jgi:hypothetical protein
MEAAVSSCGFMSDAEGDSIIVVDNDDDKKKEEEAGGDCKPPPTTIEPKDDPESNVEPEPMELLLLVESWIIRALGGAVVRVDARGVDEVDVVAPLEALVVLEAIPILPVPTLAPVPILAAGGAIMLSNITIPLFGDVAWNCLLDSGVVKFDDIVVNRLFGFQEVE